MRSVGEQGNVWVGGRAKSGVRHAVGVMARQCLASPSEPAPADVIPSTAGASQRSFSEFQAARAASTSAAAAGGPGGAADAASAEPLGRPKPYTPAVGCTSRWAQEPVWVWVCERGG